MRDNARRRFFEALKALPNAQRKQASAAHEVVRRIDALYLIERQIKDLSDDERTRIRGDEAVPQLQSLREWASKMQHETMTSGKLGEALGYLITQWPKLVRYVEDPRLAIDTNLAENAVRPFALGKAQLAFRGHRQGRKGQRSALQHRLDRPRQWPRTIRVPAPIVRGITESQNR